MVNNQTPFIDVNNTGFSSGQLTLALRNLGDGAALVQSLIIAEELIELPRLSLASGDRTEVAVQLSSKKVTTELIESPKLQLFYKNLNGDELSTIADMEQQPRADGGFNIGKIAGSELVTATSRINNTDKAALTIEKSKYSVALSYAGEDRGYVQAVYDVLRQNGISAFFDRDANIEIDMWGKNLPGYLQEIFGKGNADYCVIFVTDSYQNKAFTIYELENAVSHGLLGKKKDYILPVMLQGNELPAPLTPTTKYIDARNQKVSPEELALMIIAKLRGRTINPADPVDPHTVVAIQEKGNAIRLPRIPKAQHDPYSDPDYVLTYLISELEKRGEVLKENGIEVFVSKKDEQQIIKVKHGDETIYNLAIWIGGMTSDDELSFYQWNDERMAGSNSMHAFGKVKWSQEKNAYIIDLLNMSLFQPIGANYIVTPPELVELLWERIVEEIEEYHKQSH